MRLDLYLVEKKLCDSRARAQAVIKEGRVRVNETVCKKTAQKIAPTDEVSYDAPEIDYVSRGALKLVAGLEAFSINMAGKICLDLGASTGGFTQVLLKEGAQKVYAVDVGQGQLHERIAKDPRVINLEKTHAKTLDANLIPDPIELLVCDVSFISLLKALPKPLTLCGEGAHLIALVKPQFEVGPKQIGKGGIVKESEENSTGVVKNIADWLQKEGWTVKGHIDSPVLGGDGNKEFLIGASR